MPFTTGCARLLQETLPARSVDNDLTTSEIHSGSWREDATNPLPSVSQTVVGCLSSQYSSDAESGRGYAKAFTTTLYHVKSCQWKILNMTVIELNDYYTKKYLSTI